jgi:DNA-binding MarR family transcriptional regulator/ribosomal protein S18 acetylase RimI-like enzyme
MDVGAVRQVRRFNRAITQRIGALNDQFLARDRPLGEARVLWEIGAHGTDVRSLRNRLDLDAGYMSRLLRSLERAGMAVVEPDASDRRVRTVRLTEAGLEERAQLDRLSDELAWSFLEPLNEKQRARLIEATSVVERLLTAGLVEIETADATSADAQHCLDAYFAELHARFDEGFDPVRSISADAEELTEPAGLLLVARLGGSPIGCGALKFHDDAPAEIKRMWVDPSARGLGVGRRILHELEAQARLRNISMIRLETNRSLSEAIALYRKAGYVEVDAFNDEPYAHYWFEKRLAADCSAKHMG